jgi:hypothetical protein
VVDEKDVEEEVENPLDILVFPLPTQPEVVEKPASEQPETEEQEEEEDNETPTVSAANLRLVYPLSKYQSLRRERKRRRLGLSGESLPWRPSWRVSKNC